MKKPVVLLFLLVELAYIAVAQKSDTNPAWSRDNINAVLWQQKSAEYKALCFQAYTIARWRIDQLGSAKTARPRCIVVDIDETVLDNSPFQGHEIEKGVSYDQNHWMEWTAKAEADTIPGALGFLKYAAKKGYTVFYITNRLTTEQDATLRNLQKFSFPNADYKHLLMKDSTSDKEARRQLVLKKYDIALLCGDNLNDFTDIFFKKDQQQREDALNQVRAEFGKRFIILPNPMYGDWEAPLYDNKRGLTEQEKANIRLKVLKKY